jgi:predicted Zn-ribbon and HTH transcriptional regulator
MAKIRMTVWGYRCERCGHEWIPRGKLEPKICPKCKTPYWDRPRLPGRGRAAASAGEVEP